MHLILKNTGKNVSKTPVFYCKMCALVTFYTHNLLVTVLSYITYILFSPPLCLL